MGPSESKAYSNPLLSGYYSTTPEKNPISAPTMRMAGERWDTKKYGLDGIGMKDIEGWRGEGRSDSEIFDHISKSKADGGQIGSKALAALDEYSKPAEVPAKPETKRYYVEGDAATDGSYRNELHGKLGEYGKNNGNVRYLNTGNKADADVTFNEVNKDYDSLFSSIFK